MLHKQRICTVNYVNTANVHLSPGECKQQQQEGDDKVVGILTKKNFDRVGFVSFLRFLYWWSVLF